MIFFFFFYFERCPEIILKEKFSFCCCSVLQLRLTLCNPVVQHARIPCPSLSPSVCASSCPLSGQCHPTILSSANPLSSCPQPPNISVFSNESALCIRWPNYWNFISVLPVSIQGWFPLGLTGLTSLLSKRLLRVFSSTKVWKHQFFSAQSSLWPNSHIHAWLLEKPQL